MLSTISSQERLVFSKFHGVHVPRLHHGETLLQLNLFAQPMNRAEVLREHPFDPIEHQSLSQNEIEFTEISHETKI